MTKLTLEQKKQCVALGASLSEVSDLQKENLEFEEILELCGQIKAHKTSERSAAADEQAQATQRAHKLESYKGAFAFPAKSTFSYPEGDAAKPRPELPYKIFWLGQPIRHDVNTAAELEGLIALQPGKYLVTKSDGSKCEVHVNARIDPTTQKIDQKEVWFRTRGTDRFNHLSMEAYLREILAQQSVVALASA